MKLGFVILHFNTIRETKECTASIFEKTDLSDYEIVIVDNASPDGSGKELEEYYRDEERVHVILNPSNDGFARGNNVGYVYARETLQCDFICCMNNDTKLVSDNFGREIEEEYARSSFAVCGPRIILRDGSDNYMYMQMPGRGSLEAELKEYRRMLRLMDLHLGDLDTAWKIARNRILRMQRKKIPFSYEDCYIHSGTKERHTGILLHGCCLIFSPLYMQQFSDAFDPRTFLFREEEILWLRCQDRNLTTVYDPELIIWHKEDAATDSILRGRTEKKRRRLQYLADSLEVELAVLDEMENRHA